MRKIALKIGLVTVIAAVAAPSMSSGANTQYFLGGSGDDRTISCLVRGGQVQKIFYGGATNCDQGVGLRHILKSFATAETQGGTLEQSVRAKNDFVENRFKVVGTTGEATA